MSCVIQITKASPKEAGKGGVADARELKPMVGGDEEAAALQEFHFHFLSLSVFTDCTSSEEMVFGHLNTSGEGRLTSWTQRVAI